DLWLGPEGDIVRHACLSATVRIVSPLMREIETIGDRQAAVIIGGRQAHNDLAVILLAKMATLLPCHTDGMFAFLSHPSVDGDQRPDRTVPLDGGQHAGAHCREHCVV